MQKMDEFDTKINKMRMDIDMIKNEINGIQKKTKENKGNLKKSINSLAYHTSNANTLNTNRNLNSNRHMGNSSSSNINVSNCSNKNGKGMEQSSYSALPPEPKNITKQIPKNYHQETAMTMMNKNKQGGDSYQAPSMITFNEDNEDNDNSHDRTQNNSNHKKIGNYNQSHRKYNPSPNRHSDAYKYSHGDMKGSTSSNNHNISISSNANSNIKSNINSNTMTAKPIPIHLPIPLPIPIPKPRSNQKSQGKKHCSRSSAMPSDSNEDIIEEIRRLYDSQLTLDQIKKEITITKQKEELVDLIGQQFNCPKNDLRKNCAYILKFMNNTQGSEQTYQDEIDLYQNICQELLRRNAAKINEEQLRSYFNKIYTVENEINRYQVC